MISFPKFGAASGAVYGYDHSHFLRSMDAFDEAVYPAGPTFTISDRALRAKVCSNTLHEVGISGGFIAEALG